jgi:DNA-binding NarL/FixJ family response regulator
MKILVIDDHALVREGLRNVMQGLGSDVEVLEAEFGQQGCNLAAQHPDLDLVLLDLALPDMSGLDALDLFGMRHADLPVVILSGTGDAQVMRQCLDRGAAGFLPKSSLSGILVSALRLVLAGGTYVPPEMLFDTSPRTRRPDTLAGLGITRRQAEVLQLMVNGCSNKDIARQLGLSDQTIKTHVTAILRTLNVQSRSRAVVAAARFGCHPSDATWRPDDELPP